MKTVTKCLNRVISSEWKHRPNYILINEVRPKYPLNFIIRNEMMKEKQTIARLNEIRSTQLSTIYPIHTSTSYFKDSSQQ